MFSPAFFQINSKLTSFSKKETFGKSSYFTLFTGGPQKSSINWLDWFFLISLITEGHRNY